MDIQSRYAMRKAFPSVSPYLLRPLRTHAEALTDIETARSRVNTVTAFIPMIVEDAVGTKSRIAA